MGVRSEGHDDETMCSFQQILRNSSGKTKHCITVFG